MVAPPRPDPVVVTLVPANLAPARLAISAFFQKALSSPVRTDQANRRVKRLKMTKF
jgi:hypothetical protein